MSRKPWRLGAILAVGLVVAGTVSAGVPDGIAFVQFPPIMAPAQPVPGGMRMATVTVILQLEPGVRGWPVCRREVVVRDAVLQTLYKDPIPMRSNGQLSLKNVHARVLGPIQRALGSGLVARAFVIGGTDGALGGRRGFKIDRTSRCKVIGEKEEEEEKDDDDR